MTSVAGDPAAGADYDPSPWLETFPHLAWIVERIPHDGRGDWFERVSLHAWSRGRVAVLGDAATAQPPFLGQGGGLAMMAGLSLACHLDAVRAVEAGLAAWEAREKRLFTWVQTVSHGYGELARRPAWVRTAALKTLGACGYLRRKTVRVAAMHEPTGSPAARPLSQIMPALHPAADSPR